MTRQCSVCRQPHDSAPRGGDLIDDNNKSRSKCYTHPSYLWAKYFSGAGCELSSSLYKCAVSDQQICDICMQNWWQFAFDARIVLSPQLTWVIVWNGWYIIVYRCQRSKHTNIFDRKKNDKRNVCIIQFRWAAICGKEAGLTMNNDKMKKKYRHSTRLMERAHSDSDARWWWRSK